jgi:hypothetical protein
MSLSMAAQLAALPIRSANPWDESTVLTSKLLKVDTNWYAEIHPYVDNFVYPAHGCTPDLYPSLPVKYISVPMAHYYGSLIFGLKPTQIPALESVIAAGEEMLLSPHDFAVLCEIQKARGFRLLVTAQYRPAFIKMYQTMKVTVRNLTTE